MDRRSRINTISVGILIWIMTVRIVGSFLLPAHRQYRRPSTTRGVASVVDVIDGFYQSQPYVSAFLTCSIKASAADYFSQTRSSGATTSEATQPDSNQSGAFQSSALLVDVNTHSTVIPDTLTDVVSSTAVDIPRNLAFLCYGGIYQGLCEQFMYNTLFPAWFGDFPVYQKVALQVATDVALIGPFVCLPTAYVVMSLFTSRSTGITSDDTTDVSVFGPTWNTVAAGLTKYKQDVVHRHLLRNYWALWIPVQSLTFGVIPPHYRVAFVAMISFAWVYNLSSVATSTTDSNA